MKIAVAQISCSLGDPSANISKIGDFCSRAKNAGVELIVFPEMVDTGYSMPVIQAHATSWREGAVPELQKIAKSLCITIVSGVSERETDCIYNSQIVIGTNGKVKAKYRKTHLFTSASIDEHECFSAGNELTSFVFGPFRLGLSICYDLRFPEVYRTLAVNNEVNVFVISSAWPFPRLEHFRVLALARAIENQSYVIAANRVGRDDGVSFCGSSAIIDPYGVTISAASSDREELLVAEILPEVTQTVRSKMAIFAHRRQELYEKHPSMVQHTE